MILKKLIFSLDCRFIRIAYQASIMFFILYFFLDVSKLSKFINDNSCNDVREQYFKEGAIDDIRKESSIMTTISISTRRLSDNPLGIERINTSHNGRAVSGDVIDVDIYGLMLIQDLYIVVYGKETEDESEGSG